MIGDDEADRQSLQDPSGTLRMAFSSTSFILKSFENDVFLSFRGEDTSSNCFHHLCSAFQQNSIYTYKDAHKIKTGKTVNCDFGSIEDSKSLFIVSSKNYASSSWCLDELVKIMECQKKETAGKWVEALKEPADLTTNGHEVKLIQRIVEELSLELRSINFSIDEKLVVMESQVKDVLSSLGTDLDDVSLIGSQRLGRQLWLRAVFGQISFQFDGKSFVENVSKVTSASLCGLKSLQNQALSSEKRMMRGRKVLIILDDVDHIDQLEALSGESNWFKTGSRIIITTRDEEVLVAHGRNFIQNVHMLSDKEAI